MAGVVTVLLLLLSATLHDSLFAQVDSASCFLFFLFILMTMGKFYKLFLLLLLCFLASCGDDDDTPSPGPINAPDKVQPNVKLVLPEANSTFLVINPVLFTARLSDNDALGNMRAFLVDADGVYREVMEPFVFTYEVKYTDYGHLFFPRDVAPGTYKLMLEVKDREQNLAKDSVTLTIHAPDIDKTEFTKAFEKGNFFRFLDWGWFEFNFTNGIEFNESQFSAGMFMMLYDEYSTPKEQWEKFVKDFRFEKQSWATWDEDGNSQLTDEEFRKGLARLGLFDEWDLNNDGLVKEAEFAAGIFDRWDRNRNKLLSRDEYFDLFYTYLAPY